MSWIDSLNDPLLELKAELAYHTGDADADLESLGEIFSEMKKLFRAAPSTLVLDSETFAKRHNAKRFRCQRCDVNLLIEDHVQSCAILRAYNRLQFNPERFTVNAPPPVKNEARDNQPEKRKKQPPADVVYKTSLPRRLPL